MATEFKKINQYDSVSSVGANDNFLLFDDNGSCKKMKCSDYQAVTPPPIEYQNAIYNNVRIAVRAGNYLSLKSLSSAASYQHDMVGIALPEYGRIIYPQVVSLPWGSSSSQFITGTTNYTNLTSGAADTLKAYNDSESNRGNDCAIGYAHNFERYVLINNNERGIPAGSWYLPSASEFMMIVAPNMVKLKYAASLFGYSWPNVFWSCSDGAATKAKRFDFNTCNVLQLEKSNSYGVLLMASMPVELPLKS